MEQRWRQDNKTYILITWNLVIPTTQKSWRDHENKLTWTCPTLTSRQRCCRRRNVIRTWKENETNKTKVSLMKYEQYGNTIEDTNFVSSRKRNVWWTSEMVIPNKQNNEQRVLPRETTKLVIPITKEKELC